MPQEYRSGVPTPGQQVYIDTLRELLFDSARQREEIACFYRDICDSFLNGKGDRDHLDVVGRITPLKLQHLRGYHDKLVEDIRAGKAGEQSSEPLRRRRITSENERVYVYTHGPLFARAYVPLEEAVYQHMTALMRVRVHETLKVNVPHGHIFFEAALGRARVEVEETLDEIKAVMDDLLATSGEGIEEERESNATWYGKTWRTLFQYCRGADEASVAVSASEDSSEESVFAPQPIFRVVREERAAPAPQNPYGFV